MLLHLGEVADLLKSGPAGLLLDLDGTISEIVHEPAQATISQGVKAALKELRLRLALVAIITGRSAQQARDIVGVDQLVYVGNHGLERLEKGTLTVAEEAKPFARSLRKLMERLRARDLSGVEFEDKGASFAIHYRNASNPGEAARSMLKAITELSEGQVKLLMGKSVINVLPPVSLTKGSAVVSLVRDSGLSAAILIGDDVTDIDSFQAVRRLSDQRGFRAISIAVIGPESPAKLEDEAEFTLSNVSEVEGFLLCLRQQTC